MTLQILKQSCFCLVSEKILHAPFVDAQELHSSRTLKANVCIFLNVSLRKYLSQRRSKILSGRGSDGGRLGNLLKVARCLDLFILIEIQLFFSISIFLSIALKH